MMYEFNAHAEISLCASKFTFCFYCFTNQNWRVNVYQYVE